jgi:hypothetical protein
MALLEPPPETSNRPRVWIFAGGAIVVLAAIVLYFTFRFYPEQRAVQHFFDALVAGDFNTAYKLWKPGPSYQMRDFIADWGDGAAGRIYGYYGPVKSYKIVRMQSPEGPSDSVAAEVAVSPFSPMPQPQDAEKSGRTRVVTVWVNSRDKSLSFPP